MDNYLNEITRKSITKFSIDTAQQALEFLKKIHDGKDVNYESFSNEDPDEPQPPELINDIQDKQDSVINALLKEDIHYELIPNTKVFNIDNNGKEVKFVCMIFNNVDHFIKIINDKIKDFEDYTLYLHETFIEKDYDGSYKLYYCLKINRQKIKDDCQEIDTSNVKTKIECQKIIRQKVIDTYSNDDNYNKILNLVSKYTNKLKIFDNGSTNIQEIVDLIESDFKNKK